MVDVSVARTFAQACADTVGIALEDIEFVWNLEQAQFHGFRSLAWMLGQDDVRVEMDEALPRRLEYPSRMAVGHQVGWRKALDGYARIKKSDDNGVLYGDESFSSFARVRRRFHTEVFGPDYAAQFEGGTRNRGGKSGFPVLPDLWVSKLDFAALNGRTSDWLDDEDDEDEDG
jgi:hypothetical protein